MLEIDFGGVLLRGNVPYGTKSVLVVGEGGLSGWEGSPSGRRESVVRPGAHGEYDLPVFRSARVVTISGYVIARSGFDLMGFRSQLTGVGADGDRVRVAVKQHGDTTFVDARVVECSFTELSKRGQFFASYSIELVCADPRKYGEQQSFSGSSVQVFHRGNFPASPVVEVSGPRSAPYTVSGPGGRQVTVAQSLSAGQTHRIDFATGALYRNNARQLGQITHFRPWAIPPGKQTAMSISAGSMKVLVDDTYM